MQDQPATKSPLLGPAAVLGRNGAVPNNTGQGQRQKVVPTFVTFLVPTLRMSTADHTGNTRQVTALVPRNVLISSAKVLLSALINMPPSYKQNVPFALRSCADLVESSFTELDDLE